MSADALTTPTAAQPEGLRAHERFGYPLPVMAGGAGPVDAPAPNGDGAAAPQQQGDQGNSPWNLDAHPEELRPYLAAELQKIEGNVTKRFQEAAEFRRSVEPLLPLLEAEDIDLSQIAPEDLQGLIGLYPTFSDPEAFESWWESVGNEMGFFDGEDGEGPEGADAGDGEPPAWAKSLVERLDQLEGGFQERSQADLERDALAAIDQEMTELKEANSDLPWDDEKLAVEDRILQLALSYGDDPEALQKGLADYRAITGAAQGALVDSAENAPSAPLSGGNGSTAPEGISSFDDAKAAARRRFVPGAR